MRRIALWAASTLSVLVLLFGYHTSTSGPDGVTASAPPAITGAVTTQSGSTSTSASTVTGAAVDTRWGPVQVAITVDAGQITAVDVPVYPTENHRDQEINSYALPILVQETLDSQGSSIDMVSGATVTSVGYQQSLQSALDEAGL